MVMYNARYYLKTEKTPKGEHSKTYLYASFNFSREIAPIDKSEARVAMDLVSQGKCPEYFPNVDVLDRVHDRGFFAEYYRNIGSNKMIGIRKHLFNLGFSISITADGNVPLEDMLRMEALNNFVLNAKKE